MNFNRFNCLMQDMGRGVHNLNTDTLKIMLTDTVPVATNAVYSDISTHELDGVYGYTTGGQAITGQSFTQTSGVGGLAGDNLAWTAVSSSMGPFRYAVLYNAQSGKGGPLLGWWDEGGEVTVGVGATHYFTKDSSGFFFKVG